MVKEALPAGGAERQFALIARHLPARWERRVWTMGGGPFADAIATTGVPVSVCARQRRLDVRPALPLSRLLFEWRPDLVHSWDWMSTLAAVPTCVALRIPIVDATIRNGAVRPRGARQRRLAHSVSRLVVANSQAGLRAWSVPSRKGRVVYNAFDPDRLSLVGPRSQERLDGRHCVVMTGRMVDDKDFSCAIAAARRLDRERPGAWLFLLLGDGPLKPRLSDEAGDLCKRDVVRFVEPGLEVLPLVSQADIGILMADEARNREGCSNVIMEYMSCGLPVVCSDGGGNPELVLDGVNGYVVPPGDAEMLAERLVRLVDCPADARRLGDAGRRRILEEFTIERLVSGTERVYWEALS